MGYKYQSISSMVSSTVPNISHARSPSSQAINTDHTTSVQRIALYNRSVALTNKDFFPKKDNTLYQQGMKTFLSNRTQRWFWKKKSLCAFDINKHSTISTRNNNSETQVTVRHQAKNTMHMSWTSPKSWPNSLEIHVEWMLKFESEQIALNSIRDECVSMKSVSCSFNCMRFPSSFAMSLNAFMLAQMSFTIDFPIKIHPRPMASASAPKMNTYDVRMYCMMTATKYPAGVRQFHGNLRIFE